MKTGTHDQIVRERGTTARRYHHGDLRAALLDAAEAELAARGVEGFSLRSVAKRAGVSHAAPAHHFGDVNGLLTALAAEGFRRFLATQHARESQAASDPRSQVLASGFGYVEFAMRWPAMFRLLFSSSRPDFEDADLANAATAAFTHLVDGVRRMTGREPWTDPDTMSEVATLWSVAHGTADLMASGRMAVAVAPEGPARDRAILRMLSRALPPETQPH